MVIAIVVFAILVSSDDFIRTKDGVLQMDNNWLVGEYEKKNNVGYYKIGEVGEMENFYLVNAEGSATKYVMPAAEDSTITMSYVGSVNAGYTEFAEMLKTIYEIDESASAEMTVDGNKALYIFSAAAETEEVAEDTEEAPAEETVEDHDHSEEEEAEHTEDDGHDHSEHDHDHSEEIVLDVPSAYLLIDYDDTHSIMVELTCTAETTEEEARAAIEEIGAAITIEDR